ncbi:unnamed protein product [Boreogadus saida]
MAAPVSCVACQELPEEGILSRHLFFSPAVDLADAIDLFRAGPDLDDDDGIIDADADDSMDDVFGDSPSGFSRSRVATATFVQHEKPCRMADLFGEIMDDLLILSNSEATARRDTMLVINHLSFLGFAINWEKSSPLPSRQTVYLGLCIDSATMTAMLSPPLRDTILSALSRFRVRRNVNALSPCAC